MPYIIITAHKLCRVLFSNIIITVLGHISDCSSYPHHHKYVTLMGLALYRSSVVQLQCLLATQYKTIPLQSPLVVLYNTVIQVQSLLLLLQSQHSHFNQQCLLLSMYNNIYYWNNISCCEDF